MPRLRNHRAVLAAFMLSLAPAAGAADDAAGARLVTQPAINESGIVFAYAGDLFWVGRKGGEARRLTTSPGVEKDPHLSPMGASSCSPGTTAATPTSISCRRKGGSRAG